VSQIFKCAYMMSKIADKVGSSQGLNRLNKNVYMMQKIADKAAQ